jgi:hypothetical protein
VRLNGVELRGNMASAGSGGAVHVAAAGRVALSRCTLARNQAALSGGAVFLGAWALLGWGFMPCLWGGACLAVHTCSLPVVKRAASVAHRLAAAPAGESARVGLPPPYPTQPRLLISTCTLTANTAQAGDGGGLAVAAAGRVVLRSASQLTGNVAGRGGGGLALLPPSYATYDRSGTGLSPSISAALVDCTVEGNSAAGGWNTAVARAT